MSEKLNNIRSASEWFEDMDKMFAKRGLAPELPIKSMSTLNTFLWGLHKQEMTVIGARTGNCKSVMAIQLAWDMAKQGRSVYFMSLEMTAPRILERIFSNEYRIDNTELMRGAARLDPIVVRKYAEFKDQISKYRLVISDMIGRTTADIEDIDKAFATYPDVFVIDHLNEISAGQNKFEAIDKYLTTIRAMAIRRDCALVVCCQVNRSSRTDEDKMPQLHQLKGSGSIEEKADSCVLINYQRMYDQDASKNDIDIFISKNRNGPTGYGKLYIHPEYSRISDDGKIFDNSRTGGDGVQPEHGTQGAVHSADVLRGSAYNEREAEPVWTE